LSLPLRFDSPLRVVLKFVLSEKPVYRFDQHVNIRLWDEGCRTGAFGFLAVRVVDGPGVNNDWSVRVELPYVAAQRQAFAFGEASVEDVEVERLSLCERQRRFDIHERLCLVVFMLQQVRQQVAGVRIIINTENATLGG
jgi:hypothetical protein